MRRADQCASSRFLEDASAWSNKLCDEAKWDVVGDSAAQNAALGKMSDAGSCTIQYSTVGACSSHNSVDVLSRLFPSCPDSSSYVTFYNNSGSVYIRMKIAEHNMT